MPNRKAVSCPLEVTLRIIDGRWVERMERLHATTITVAEFCAAESVFAPAFYQ